MRLGVALPICLVEGERGFSTDIAGSARQAESTGFDSVWTFDAIRRRRSGGHMLPDALTALAVAATATTRIEVGTGVLQVAPRNAVELAQRVLTTHLVSGGRLVLGVGAGSTRADFCTLGASYDARFEAFAANLDTMQSLWDGRSGADLEPWPDARGGPPVLIGSWGSARWIERAARREGGWIASGAKGTWARAEKGLEWFKQAGGGRAVLTNVYCLPGTARQGESADDPVALSGTDEDIARGLRRIADLGYDDVVLVIPDFCAERLTNLRALAP
jgi:alkanesulfonate monooxygenase SsuD/methylene tetrahydromethanopterin reductase-like flavin-dependent oxidoreductase (luciferase family)